MSIQGNLDTMELSELLQWLCQGRKSGTIVIRHGGVEKQIVLDEGRIVSSASSDPEEQLGRYLVSRGIIDAETLRRALGLQRVENIFLGKILVSLGAVGEEKLADVLRAKTEESIYGIFYWPEGEFEFRDGDLPSRSMVSFSLDVTAVVLEGIKRLDEERRAGGGKARVPVGFEISAEEATREELLEPEPDHRPEPAPLAPPEPEPAPPRRPAPRRGPPHRW